MARGVCRRPCGATARRSQETDGRSRPLPAGWCAKAHETATTKSSGSSRERQPLCPRLVSSRGRSKKSQKRDDVLDVLLGQENVRVSNGEAQVRGEHEHVLFQDGLEVLRR